LTDFFADMNFITHPSLISGNENLINCLKCSLAKALSVLPAYLLVQKDHFEVKESPLFCLPYSLKSIQDKGYGNFKTLT